MSDTPKRPVGRPAGSVNKITEELRALVDAEPGLHPAVLLKRIANNPSTEPALVIQASTALLPYIAPKLKSLEITGQDGGAIQATTTIFKSVRPKPEDWGKTEAEHNDGDDSDE